MSARQPIVARTITWTGAAGTSLWSDPANWSVNALPAPGDDVVLDNSAVPAGYLVQLPDISVTVQSISIRPSAAASIELLLPASNVNNDALVLTGTGYPLLLASGAVFRNACGISSGASINLSDSFRIENGGRYVHSTRGTHASTLLAKLSSAPGTELGIFEFNVPRASYTISVSNRTYGTLRLRSDAYARPVNYTCSGSNPLLVRGDLDIGTGVNLSIDLATAKGRITVGGDLLQQAGILTLGSGSGDSTLLQVQGNVVQQDQAVLTSAADAFPWLELIGTANQKLSVAGSVSGNVGLRIDNPAGVKLQHTLTLTKVLQLLSGPVETSAVSLLTLGPDCRLIADSLVRDAFIDGPLCRTVGTQGNGTLFPVGAGGSARWMALQSGSGTFTVSYVPEDPRALAAATGTGIDHISSKEYWLLQSTGPVAGKVELSHAVPESGGITEPAVLRVAQLIGGQWTDAGESAFTGGLITGSVVSNTVSDFSGKYFTLASAVAGENPLPLNIISFAVSRNDDRIRFRWTWTGAEQPAAFEIMLGDSIDARTFLRTAAQPGRSDYGWSIPDTLSGSARVWRVDMIDSSGERHIGRSALTAAVNSERIILITLPPQGGSPVLYIRSVKPGFCSFELYTEYGARVRINDLAYYTGENRWPLCLTALRRGIYFLRLQFKDGSGKTLRFLW